MNNKILEDIKSGQITWTSNTLKSNDSFKTMVSVRKAPYFETIDNFEFNHQKNENIQARIRQIIVNN